MVRFFIGLAMLGVASSALAQTPAPQPLGDSAKAAVGTWEFSNAEHDKTCTLTLKPDPAPSGFKLEFDKECAAKFPLVGGIAAWKYPNDDFLTLIDAQGRAVVEFSETENGMYEAPTPGVGVLFLQNASAAPPAPAIKPEQVAGDWTVMRGNNAICMLTLAVTPADNGFALAVKPGCDAAIARLNFAQWKLDADELMLVPARGTPWRFEEGDTAGSWDRVPETAEGIRLVKK